jgi:hypothetical protein
MRFATVLVVLSAAFATTSATLFERQAGGYAGSSCCLRHLYEWND